MKKVFAGLLLAALMLSLCACDGGWSPSSYWEMLEQETSEEYMEEWGNLNSDEYAAVEETEPRADMTQPVTDPPEPTEEPTTAETRKPTTQLEYWIENCDKAYLSEMDLYGMNKQDCRIARNAIYAKSGRMFNSQDMVDYFENYYWYNPTIKPDSFKESMLSQIQRHNLNVVTEYERKCGYQ